MKSISRMCLILAIVSLGLTSLSRDSGQKEPLVLTYVANTGALAAAGDLKVLVDALFDKPNPEYRAPAPEVLEKIMKGATPFDGVDLVLVTHNHPDHFEARLAVRYLETLPEPNCARFLQEVLKPDHIALTHLPVRLEGDALGKIGQVREFYKDIFLLLSGMPAKVFQK